MSAAPGHDVTDEATTGPWPSVVLVAVVALVAVSAPLLVRLVSLDSSADFADTEVLGTNRLGAATLRLSVTGGPGGGSSTGGGSGGGTGAVLSARNLAPGDLATGRLVMTNEGDVPLRYGLSGSTDGGPLGPWLRFEVWRGKTSCGPDQGAPRLVQGVVLGPTPKVLIDRGSGVSGVLQPGDVEVWCIGARLPLETPNQAQGKGVEITVLVPVEQVAEGDG